MSDQQQDLADWTALNIEVIDLKEKELAGYKVIRLSTHRVSKALEGELEAFTFQGPTTVVFLADPATVAFLMWLAEKAAEAIVSAAAMTLFNALFGKKINWEEFAKNLLIEFSHILRKQLKEEAIERATSKLHQHQKSFNAYMRNPQGRQDTFGPLTVAVEENVGELARLGAPAAGAYALAASLDLSIKLERFFQSTSEGEWDTYAEAITDFKQHAVKVHDEIVRDTPKRFTNYVYAGFGIAEYHFDGQRIVIQGHRGPEEARRHFLQHVQSVTLEVINKVASPIAGVANQWERTLARRPNRNYPR